MQIPQDRLTNKGQRYCPNGIAGVSVRFPGFLYSYKKGRRLVKERGGEGWGDLELAHCFASVPLFWSGLKGALFGCLVLGCGGLHAALIFFASLVVKQWL